MMIRRMFRGALTALLLMVSVAMMAAPDAKAGKALFLNQCATCHAKDMKTKLTGPALAGVEDRWSAFPRTELYAWIRNSQALVAKGHPRAVAVFNENNKSVMTSFPNIKDEEIENILAYISEAAKPQVAVADKNATSTKKEESGTSWWYWVLFLTLGGLVLIMTRVISYLHQLTEVRSGNTDAKRRTLADLLTSRGVISFLVFLLVVLGMFTTVNNAISMSRQQGYKPTQPIKFSHAIHAGQQKIDCQYCHDGARRSKHSIIPAANTCMNCHKAVKVGTQTGTSEITKIFASIGYDPNTDTYIANYDQRKENEVAALYKKWIGSQVKASNDKASAGEMNAIADQQWEDIKTSLTHANKPNVAGPIEWVRVHNLPDHAYFNHAQHVTVGKVACQKCHGKVEEMEVLGQFSPLSMGWCVNCHRQTEVQFKDNDYYKTYARYHDELNKGEREKVTVEDIGGLECQKCHY